MHRVVRIAQRIEDALLVVILGFMIALAAWQILLRNFFDSGIAWGDPLLRLLVLWLGLLGAMVGARTDKHIRIDVLTRFMPERIQRFSHVITALFTAFVCALLAFHASRLVFMDWKEQTSIFTGLPAWLFEIIIPLGFTIMALRYLALGASELRKKPVASE